MSVEILTIGTCLVELSPGDGDLTIAEAPVLYKQAAGAATHFACVVSKLGVRSGLVSCVGDDSLGEFMIGELTGMGVDASLVGRVQGQLTSVSFASADRAGGKTFTFYRFSGYSDPLETLVSGDIPDEALAGTRLFDFTEGCLRSPGILRDSTLNMADRCRNFGVETCYAPNWRPGLWHMGLEDALHTQRRAIRSCDLLILNTEEALLISEESTVVAAAVRLGSWGPHTVVVTGGGDRPALVWERGQTWEVVPFPVDVRYDVNAGDTFHAGFLSAHVRGIAAAGAGQFAAAAAAIKISRIPLLTNLPTWDEVERFLVGARPPEPCRPGSAGRR